MKKENRKIAQQKRAAERVKKERNRKLAMVTFVVAVVAIVVGLVFALGSYKQEVKRGDVVNIDYTGYLDGETFAGGSTNGAGANLLIGSGTYIEGFEEGIIGHKVGETFDLHLTFPENYGNSDLAGKDVVFTVTINSIVQ